VSLTCRAFPAGAGPDQLRRAASLIRVADMNLAAVAQNAAQSKQHLLENLPQLFEAQTYQDFLAELDADLARAGFHRVRVARFAVWMVAPLVRIIRLEHSHSRGATRPLHAWSLEARTITGDAGSRRRPFARSTRLIFERRSRSLI